MFVVAFESHINQRGQIPTPANGDQKPTSANEDQNPRRPKGTKTHVGQRGPEPPPANGKQSHVGQRIPKRTSATGDQNPQRPTDTKTHVGQRRPKPTSANGDQTPRRPTDTENTRRPKRTNVKPAPDNPRKNQTSTPKHTLSNQLSKKRMTPARDPKQGIYLRLKAKRCCQDLEARIWQPRCGSQGAGSRSECLIRSWSLRKWSDTDFECLIKSSSLQNGAVRIWVLHKIAFAYHFVPQVRTLRFQIARIGGFAFCSARRTNKQSHHF